MTNRIIIKRAGAGDLFGAGVFNILAETARGERFVFGRTFHDEAAADRFAARVERAGSIDPTLWADFYPTYGSEAYEAEEAEASMYAGSLSRGVGSLDEVPANIRTLL